MWASPTKGMTIGRTLGRTVSVGWGAGRGGPGAPLSRLQGRGSSAAGRADREGGTEARGGLESLSRGRGED